MVAVDSGQLQRDTDSSTQRLIQTPPYSVRGEGMRLQSIAGYDTVGDLSCVLTLSRGRPKHVS